MWPFRRPADPPPRPLLERLDELEDNQRRLERRFVRLQGEFDRVNRVQVEEDLDDSEDEIMDMIEERKHARG